MDTYSREIDKIVMDIISGNMYSLNFLRNISVAIFDQQIKHITVQEFYAEWLKKIFIVVYCLVKNDGMICFLKIV